MHCEYITESIKNANNLMIQVIMSYTDADRAAMEKIRNSLRRESITVWTDKTDIQTGEASEEAIKRGIEQADNVVYLPLKNYRAEIRQLFGFRTATLSDSEEISNWLIENYQDLLYVRRRYIHKDQLRSAIAEVINAIFEIRLPHIWGEGTTTCASDSKHFGAWEQNLMTQYHLRYGGRGVMIYWHVEKKSTCIYSQLKTCSSSEVAAMIEGVLRHCTNMEVEKNYVDSHGQSEVAFAFTHLLGFQLSLFCHFPKSLAFSESQSVDIASDRTIFSD